MKISKNFRLSEEAVAVLDEQENATQFIEGLLLDKQSRAITFTQMHDLLQELFENIKNISLAPPIKNIEINRDGQVQPRDPAKPSVISTRTKSAVKQEIDALEEERRSELEFIQDAKSTAEIHKKYQTTIDGLWREFHSL